MYKCNYETLPDSLGPQGSYLHAQTKETRFLFLFPCREIKMIKMNSLFSKLFNDGVFWNLRKNKPHLAQMQPLIEANPKLPEAIKDK